MLGLLGLFSSAASNPAELVYSLFGWASLILIIYLIYKGIRKLFGSSSVHSDALTHLSSPDFKAINSEKHGCKCYMEGLTLGEQEVADTLSRELSYKNYFIFNNLILPSENNGSTQIDHIVVSRFGIFVIESKDYKGWIFGGRDEKNVDAIAAGREEQISVSKSHPSKLCPCHGAQNSDAIRRR